MDDGDFVVVKNIEKIKFTGKKFQNKKYFRHTGHPGGIKETTPEKLHVKKPEEVLKLAVKRMLPGGVLGKKQLTKLKIYSGNDHPHSAQNPTVIEFSRFLPASNSSLILSDINIFASTAKPIDSIKAAAPERVKVTGRILKIETTNRR